MKVKRIDLDDEQMPARIQVELSHDEATYLAVLLGQLALFTSSAVSCSRVWEAPRSTVG